MRQPEGANLLFYRFSRPTQIPSAKICQIFIFEVGGGWGKPVVVQTNIPEILGWGHSRNFEQNICQAKLTTCVETNKKYSIEEFSACSETSLSSRSTRVCLRVLRYTIPVYHDLPQYYCTSLSSCAVISHVSDTNNIWFPSLPFHHDNQHPCLHIVDTKLRAHQVELL